MQTPYALAFLTLLSAGAAKPAPRVPALPKSTVAGVPVGGLSPQAARTKLASRLDRKLDQKLVLAAGSRRVVVPRRKLAIGLDLNGMVAAAKAGRNPVPLRLRVNRELLQKTLRGYARRFKAAPTPPKILDRGGRVQVAPSRAGRTLNAAASAQRIAAAVEKKPSTRVVRLVIDKTPAKSANALKGITGRLARFTTTFNAGKTKRVHNIRVAVRRIDGTILRPGEVFSLNKAVGPRTHENGFLTAPVFENKKLVPGIGGGVSQVTGTLFNAALVAGLPIVEYHTHAGPVHYLPVGRDATVAWGAIDMKFRNNTRAPIYISYKVSGSHLTAALYGARPRGQQVTVSVKAQHPGKHLITAQLYRAIRRGGKVAAKQKIGESKYDWKPEKPD